MQYMCWIGVFCSDFLEDTNIFSTDDLLLIAPPKPKFDIEYMTSIESDMTSIADLNLISGQDLDNEVIWLEKNIRERIQVSICYFFYYVSDISILKQLRSTNLAG